MGVIRYYARLRGHLDEPPEIRLYPAPADWRLWHIVPWNFPLGNGGVEAGPGALRAGTQVVKDVPVHPLSLRTRTLR